MTCPNQVPTAKNHSLATPLDMAVSRDGKTLYLAAFGSSKIGVFDTTALRNNTFDPRQISANYIPVSGGGPSGLVLDEVRGLDGLRGSPTASRAIGYAQALDQLDGVLSQDEAIASTAAATRRLVRRQESWFRPDPRITWLPHDASDLVERALGAIHASRTMGT